MNINELALEALDAAEQVAGDSPVVMVNLLWFRDVPAYPDGFQGAKQDARSAYFEGYAGAFGAIAAELEITAELVYAGTRLAGLLAGPDDDWDMVVIVRYNCLADLRKIVDSEAYDRIAAPHRRAAIANWRFFATRA